MAGVHRACAACGRAADSEWAGAGAMCSGLWRPWRPLGRRPAGRRGSVRSGTPRPVRVRVGGRVGFAGGGRGEAWRPSFSEPGRAGSLLRGWRSKLAALCATRGDTSRGLGRGPQDSNAAPSRRCSPLPRRAGPRETRQNRLVSWSRGPLSRKKFVGDEGQLETCFGGLRHRSSARGC